MFKDWIAWVNKGLIALIIFFLVLALGYQISRPTKIAVPEITSEKKPLPPSSFKMDKAAYEEIGPPLIHLKFSPMTLQLPDLKNFLVYYGKNQRPDAGTEQTSLHFSFSGSNEIASIASGEPLYLVYDKDQPRIKYIFSPQNKETSLWIEATPAEGEVSVNVSMRNEAGEIIRKPEANARFVLKERPYTRTVQDKWEIGKWKVDGTLLARQRARWYGPDLFLERHGGEEFKELAGKQRIDFGEKEELYSIFLGIGEGAPWIKGRWVQPQPGLDTRPYPMLVVKSVEDRLMKLELWDVGGKGKVSLNLIRSTDTSTPRNLEKQFKFFGARTRSQLMFEINNERILISPKDWLLFTEGRWIKLATPEDIDRYVDRKTPGPLFVVDDVSRGEGQQVLTGTLFNTARTEIKSIEIPLQQGSTAIIKEPEKRVEGTPLMPQIDQENEEEFEETPEPRLKNERIPSRFRDRIRDPSIIN